MRFLAIPISLGLLCACQLYSNAMQSQTNREPVPPLVAAAREQIGVTVSYDPAYRQIQFPMGDVPRHTGVCTDGHFRY